MLDFIRRLAPPALQGLAPVRPVLPARFAPGPGAGLARNLTQAEPDRQDADPFGAPDVMQLSLSPGAPMLGAIAPPRDAPELIHRPIAATPAPSDSADPGQGWANAPTMGRRTRPRDQRNATTGSAEPTGQQPFLTTLRSATPQLAQPVPSALHQADQAHWAHHPAKAFAADNASARADSLRSIARARAEPLANAPPRRSASAPAPVIYVTIDRIDIRAPNAAPRPAPVQRPRTPAPSVSLGDYLRGGKPRQGGAS